MSIRDAFTSSKAGRRAVIAVSAVAVAALASGSFLALRGQDGAAPAAQSPARLASVAQFPASVTDDLPVETSSAPAPEPAPVETTAPVEAAPAETTAAPAPAQPAPTRAAAPAPAPAPPAAPAPVQPETPQLIGGGLPLDYEGGASQVVTVVAPSWGSTTAKVTAWQRNSDGSWSAVVGPVSARIGSQGIGQASEDVSRTPAGTYSLTQAFGRNGNPGTGLPYFQTGPDDWWDENPDSPTYNQHVQGYNPGGASENLYYSGSVYDYAINIDYNTSGTPGAGSAFFLHVSNGAATAGCVAIDAGSLVQIMQWLTPAASPVIVLGVG